MQAVSRSYTQSLTMKMFAILDKAKPDTGNIRGFELVGGHVYDHSVV
jgi:hypothetical protein